MPTVMPVKQSYFFRTKTLPLILKSAKSQSLLKDWFIMTAENLQRQSLMSTTANFVSFINDTQEVQQVIQIDEQNKGTAIEKIRSAWNTYTKIKKILLVIKGAKKFGHQFYDSLKNKMHGVSSDQVNYEEIERRTNEIVYEKQNQLINTMEESVRPVIFQLNQMINDKLRNCMSDFFKWIMDMIFFPDWEDPIDVTIWGLGLVAAYYTRGASIGMSAVARAGKFLYKFWTVRSILRSTRNALQNGNYGKAIYKVAGAKFKWINLAALGVQAGTVIPAFVDLYKMDEGTVNTMKKQYEKRASKWGEKVEKSLVSQLQPMKNDVQWIENVVNDVTSDIDDGIRGLTANRGAMRGISKYYNTRIVVEDKDIKIKYNGSGNVYSLKDIKVSLSKISKKITTELSHKFSNFIRSINGKKCFIDYYKIKSQISLSWYSDVAFEKGVLKNFSKKEENRKTLLKTYIGILLKSLQKILNVGSNVKIMSGSLGNLPSSTSIRQLRLDEKKKNDNKTLQPIRNDIENVFKKTYKKECLTFKYNGSKGEIIVTDSGYNVLYVTYDLQTGDCVLYSAQKVRVQQNYAASVSFGESGEIQFWGYEQLKKVHVGKLTDFGFWQKVKDNTCIDCVKIYERGTGKYKDIGHGIMVQQTEYYYNVIDTESISIEFQKLMQLTTNIKKQVTEEELQQFQKQYTDNFLNNLMNKHWQSKNEQNTFFVLPEKLSYSGVAGSIGYVGYNFEFSNYYLDKITKDFNERVTHQQFNHYKLLLSKEYQAETFFKYRYQNTNDKRVKLFFTGNYRLDGGEVTYSLFGNEVITNDSRSKVGVWLNLQQLYLHEGKYFWQYGTEIKSTNSKQSGILGEQIKLNKKLTEILSTLQTKFGKE